MIDPASTLWSLVGLLLLLLPGLSWSFLLVRDDGTRLFNRLLAGIGLSLVIMPLTAFWLNLAAGVPVTSASLAVMAFLLSIAPLTHLAWKRWKRAA